MAKPIYVLGTGLSHNGSAVLLRDGKVCVGIEKERLTRRKRDGGNDTAAIQYCLDAAGIALGDVDVVVQTAHFEIPERDRYAGPRVFAGHGEPPLVDISHHLAHAWSAAGTTPFDSCAIMVIDGSGSPFEQCTDLDDVTVLSSAEQQLAPRLWCEKDSLYAFDGRDVTPLCKDFSPIVAGTGAAVRMPTTQHSIGGFYSAVSQYVFGNLDDAGKLMGLAPYGVLGAIAGPALTLRDERIFLEDGWEAALARPAADYEDFRANFQYYADIARWAQGQVEQAVAALFRARLARFPGAQVSYTGGVALNAVANARLLDEAIVEQLYLEPAAGDNGLALGCAYYGWMKVLGRPRARHDGSTCFGKTYGATEIRQGLAGIPQDWPSEELSDADLVERTAALLAEGKTVGWFRDGSEFGPRALGRRSILAHPGAPGMRDHINANIKFREDFRPFAPAVLPEFAREWFESERDSPYMILVDRTKAERRDALCNVTHVDGTARVQTVDAAWNPVFRRLLEAFHAATGMPVLLNTSFNKRGMPIVEHPQEAAALFAETALDALVLQNVLVRKPPA